MPSWEQFAAEDRVDFDPTWGVRPLVDAAFESRWLMRCVQFQVSYVHTLLEFVDRSLGVAGVPRHVSNKPQASRLVTVALPHDSPRWEVSVVQSRKAKSDSAAPHLMKLLADVPAYRWVGPRRRVERVRSTRPRAPWSQIRSHLVVTPVPALRKRGLAQLRCYGP